MTTLMSSSPAAVERNGFLGPSRTYASRLRSSLRRLPALDAFLSRKGAQSSAVAGGNKRRHARPRSRHRIRRNVPPHRPHQLRRLELWSHLSPDMAARTQRIALRRLPRARAHCQAVDARSMPFRDGSFDAVICCYLLELLGSEGSWKPWLKFIACCVPTDGPRWY